MRLSIGDVADLLTFRGKSAGIAEVTFYPLGDADVEHRANAGDRQARAHKAAMTRLINRIIRGGAEPPQCVSCREVFSALPELFVIIAAHERPSVYLCSGICGGCLGALGGERDAILVQLVPFLGTGARPIEINPSPGHA